MSPYGDPQFQAGFLCALRALHRRVAAVPDFEHLRSCLIQAGQLEQGVADSDPKVLLRNWVERMQHVTDLLAAALVQRLAPVRAGVSASSDTAAAALELASITAELERNPDCACANLSCKVPEGFEFYTLFPEQYVAATRQWLGSHASHGRERVLVVGLRAIGTSLSAVVLATLRHHGWPATRLTVRPQGHPFEREVSLGRAELGSTKFALVVDEGPGLSGSSMAAAAEALLARGIDRERIAFLPGHGHGPSSAASQKVRRWWESTPIYVAPLEKIRWPAQVCGLGEHEIAVVSSEMLGLETLLRLETARLTGVKEAGELVDIGAGAWREHAYLSESEWPASVKRFERQKYLCFVNGQPAVIWKFEGLGSMLDGQRTAQEVLDVQSKRLNNWTPQVLGCCSGFSATAWVVGARLGPADAADPGVLSGLATYMTASAGPPLSQDEHDSSIARLGEAASQSLLENIGAEPVAELRASQRAAARFATGPSYGDGRLAPHEWIRTTTGRLLKTDFSGHWADHTLIGRQSWLWDVAGALVEWNLAGPLRKDFLALLRKTGADVDTLAIRFFELAYAAFRLGQMRFCLELGQAAERDRLSRAAARYREYLLERLAGVAVPT